MKLYLLLLLSTVSLAAQVIQSDDFSGNSLNSSLWTASTVVPGSSVRVSNGLMLTNGGAVLSQTSFPNQIQVDLIFQFTGSTADSFKFISRTSSTLTSSTGNYARGILASFRMRSDPSDPAGTNNNIEIDDQNFGVSQTVLGLATYPISQGQTYFARLVETSNSVSLYINDFSVPVISANTTSFYGNQIGFYNREGAAAGSSISEGSQVTIKAVSVLSYPASAVVPSSKLINVSTLGSSGFTSGFVISGNAPKTVLVRGVGPTLATFGVQNPASQTTLFLYSGATVLGTNSGWTTAANAAQMQGAGGSFTLISGSKDSAILTTLNPGSYTAQVTGNGAILLEVYEVQ